MRRALYYPHTSVSSVALVKTALLMWDRLEFIVPRKNFVPDYDNPLIAHAMEIVGQARVPSEQEKGEAHNLISKFVRRDLPQEFFASGRGRHYEVYPEKFLDRTWEILLERGLSSQMLEDAVLSDVRGWRTSNNVDPS